MDVGLILTLISIVALVGGVFFVFGRMAKKREQEMREEEQRYLASIQHSQEGEATPAEAHSEEQVDQPAPPVPPTPSTSTPSGGGSGGNGRGKHLPRWMALLVQKVRHLLTVAGSTLIVGGVLMIEYVHVTSRSVEGMTTWQKVRGDLLLFAGLVLFGSILSFISAEWRKARRRRSIKALQEATDAFLTLKKQKVALELQLRRTKGEETPALKEEVDKLEQKLEASRKTREHATEEHRRRESLGTFPTVRMLVGNPTMGPIRISQFSLWMVSTLILVNVIIWREYGWLIGFTATLLLLLFLKSCIRVIPADPPHRGSYAFTGNRTYTEFSEGWVFLLLGLETVFIRNVQRRPLVVRPTEVRTKDNAEVQLDLNVIWGPDPDDLKTFIENDNLEQNIEDRIEEEARQFFYDHTDWFTDERTVMVRETDPDKIAEAEKNGVLPMKKAKEEYLREPWEMAQRIRHELRNHLALVITSQSHETIPNDRGVTDDHGWGIRIYGILVGEIKLAGKTKDAADKRAKEAAERAGEVYEKETEAMQAGVLVQKARELNYNLSFDHAYAMVVDYKTHGQDGAYRISLPGMSSTLQAVLLALLSQKRDRTTPQQGGVNHGS